MHHLFQVICSQVHRGQAGEAAEWPVPCTSYLPAAAAGGGAPGPLQPGVSPLTCRAGPQGTERVLDPAMVGCV